MTKIINLSTKQRELRLMDLVKDAKLFNFNEVLIKDYERQLSEVQAEISKDKEKMKININVRGLN